LLFRKGPLSDGCLNGKDWLCVRVRLAVTSPQNAAKLPSLRTKVRWSAWPKCFGIRGRRANGRSWRWSATASNKRVSHALYSAAMILADAVRVAHGGLDMRVPKLILNHLRGRATLGKHRGSVAMRESMEAATRDFEPFADRMQDIPTHVACCDRSSLVIRE
jgi:hypothetical protein